MIESFFIRWYIVQNEKIENQLNLALEITEEQRLKTINLAVGYSPITKQWELIVRYSGDLSRIKDELGISAVELSNEYAILVVPEYLIGRLADYKEIIFIEKPKLMYFENYQGRTASCINPLQTKTYNLFGQDILVAIIDSGIDYSHPDFRNEDGTTRIEVLWDQTIIGNPPPGFDIGSLYTREQINQALKVPMPERMQIVPSVDLSGHGTHVAGIAAGNGRASDGLYRGVASKSELVIVKLGKSVGNSFPKTSQLMQAIDFVIDYASEQDKPLAVNISYGNNYGSHTGEALLETYINEVSNRWKTSIIIGTGNEGAAGTHAQGILSMKENAIVRVAVASYEPSLNIQIWKNYYDDFELLIQAPDGTRVGPIPKRLGKQQFTIEQTEILLYYGDPTPYNSQQEIYIELIPAKQYQYINGGEWDFELVPKKIVTGNYDMWLPAGGLQNVGTRFLESEEVTTLTIPSTAYKAVSVGAYNSYTGSIAPFSGRGYTRNNMIKPDLVAPGVNINSCAPGGGYTIKSGTSMATPFVTGSAALLMEWGIINKNDPFLYGDDCVIIGLNQRKTFKIKEIPLV